MALVPQRPHGWAQRPRLGILGGGQLGRMFLGACHRFDIETWVLDPDPLCPAAQLASHYIQGSFRDPGAVYRFGKGVDVLTVEIEHVATEALVQLESEGIAVRPGAEVVATVQDKGIQKRLYTTHGIPTAPYRLIDDPTQLSAADLVTPKVLKLRRGGYDGQGVRLLRTEADLAHVFQAPSVLEEAIDIAAEIAVLVARSATGEVVAYPPVEMAFHPEAHLVELLFSPANLVPEMAQRCEAIAREVAEVLGVVGLLAVELFVTPRGDVLVNEIAPRPHNSGHHTLEAAYTPQFEQHLRAVLGLPLGDPGLKQPAAMVNLVGGPTASGDPTYPGLEAALRLPGVSVHLYGKRVVRPFRKMGHITVVRPTVEAAVATARQVQQLVQVTSR